jgi:manganese/zinc/iron transport system ATP- binding protein
MTDNRHSGIIAARIGPGGTGPGGPSDAALSVRGLTVSYAEKPAVFSVDASFAAGAMTAIIGPERRRKSTMLKACLGIVPRLSGEVDVFGQPVERARHRIAYVPQRASVDWDFPATVLDVVKMGLYRTTGLFGRLSGALETRARGCLDRVGMADFADRQIGQLSGGQQQRVFLARALAQDADLYLLDEPFAGVDAATERAIVDVLKSLKAEGKTVIAVHHDLATVAEYFDRVFLINVRRSPKAPWRRPSPPRRCRGLWRAACGDPCRSTGAGRIAGLTPFLDALLLQAGYNAALVAIGAGAAGFRAGATGTFLLLRKRALVSDAIAHATLPGVGWPSSSWWRWAATGATWRALLLGSASRGGRAAAHPVDRRAHASDGGCGDRRRAGRVLRLRASCC